MANCRTCGTDLAATDERRGLCEECTGVLGVVEMPPSRRPPLPCVRCHGQHFVRAVPRELTVEPHEDWNRGHHAPMFATYAIPKKRRLFSPARVPTELDARKGHGLLETYICKSCGFVEWYCHDPTEIPIGPEYMTEDVDLTAPGPYR